MVNQLHSSWSRLLGTGSPPPKSPHKHPPSSPSTPRPHKGSSSRSPPSSKHSSSQLPAYPTSCEIAALDVDCRLQSCVDPGTFVLKSSDCNNIDIQVSYVINVTGTSVDPDYIAKYATILTVEQGSDLIDNVTALDVGPSTNLTNYFHLNISKGLSRNITMTALAKLFPPDNDTSIPHVTDGCNSTLVYTIQAPPCPTRSPTPSPSLPSIPVIPRACSVLDQVVNYILGYKGGQGNSVTLFNCGSYPILFNYLVTNNNDISPNETITSVVGQQGKELLSGGRVTLLPNHNTTVSELVTLNVCNGVSLDFHVTALAQTDLSTSPPAGTSCNANAAFSLTLTRAPTTAPSPLPTALPTDTPTASPTTSPTHVPTNLPTLAPTERPTNAPSKIAKESPPFRV